jgi:hypothetical protein
MPHLRRSMLVVALHLGAPVVLASEASGETAAAAQASGSGPVALPNAPSRGVLLGTQPPPTGQTACETRGPVRISPDSVGPLPTAAPIERLLRICRGRRTMRETEEHAYPAMGFAFKGLTVLASQTADSLRLDETADTWEVKGTNGLLPLAFPLTSKWEALRHAYGAAVGHDEFEHIVVMFCRFPNMYLLLDADFDAVGPIVNNDLTRIPLDSKIVRIIISVGFPPESCVGARGPGN